MNFPTNNFSNIDSSVYYSTSSKGFFMKSLHKDVPEDVIEITKEYHSFLLEEQAKGKVISVTDDGSVVALERPAPTTEQLNRQAKVKRDILLKETDWTQLPDVQATTQLKWSPYRQALRDITLQPTYPNIVDWPVKPV